MQGSLCSVKTVIQFVVVFFVLQVGVIFIWYIQHASSQYDVAPVLSIDDNSLNTPPDTAAADADYHDTSIAIHNSSSPPLSIQVDQSSSSVTQHHQQASNPWQRTSVISSVLQGYHGVTYPAASRVPVLVIGAASFPGSRIVKYLHDSKVSLIVNEDSVNIQPDEVLWYRWEQLMSLGAKPQFRNYTDEPTVQSILKGGSHKSIVYIPTPCYSTELEFSGLRTTIEQLENFVLLLETLSNRVSAGKRSSVVLVIPAQPANPVCEFFKLSLLYYCDMYTLDAVIVQSGGLYGPWQSSGGIDSSSCYIDDLAKHVQDITSGNIESGFLDTAFECSATSRSIALEQTDRWSEEYRVYKQAQTRDVIASSYFTTKRNAQYPIEFINNNYYFMENWFINIYKMGLDMMVLHDDLNTHFTSTFKKNYAKADFIKITDFKDYKPNDRRFLGYYDYILAHPEIRRMIFTDMRDVIIKNNPFEVMEVVGDYGFVGTDRPFKRTVSESDMLFVFRRCYGHTKVPLDYHYDIQLLGFLNAGTIGGTRHVLLTFLTRFFMYFQISNRDNCNMAIVEMVFHKHLFDRLYFGWPINAAFITDQPNIPGQAVSHKWS